MMEWCFCVIAGC